MFLTKDIYFGKRGIDLDIEFRGSRYDNESNAANIFLQQEEDFVCDYLSLNYGVTKDMLDADIMQKALIYQVDFVLESGEINNQELCANAYMVLRNAGYCNMKTDGSKPIINGVIF